MLFFDLTPVDQMESSSTDQNYDLTEYRVISIEESHKTAIINLLNGIIGEPMVDSFADTKGVVYKLGQLIQLFDESFITSGIDNKTQIQLPSYEDMNDTSVSELSNSIRNWLIPYYTADSLIESLKLEEGIQEEISMAALLILNAFHQLKDSLPQAKEQLDQNWIYLAEFTDQLESMWKTDKAFSLLQTELECERIQRLADKQMLSKLEKEVNSYKRKVKQSKEMLEKLKKFASKPAPKSKKKGGAMYTPTATRGKGKKGRGGRGYIPPDDDDVEPDDPPIPGTPVLLSSSGSGSSCRYCGKWFNDSIKMNKHLVIHAGSKPFACDWPGCGRPFDSNYKLQRHRRCHTGERPFGCDECGKRFTRSDKLREHQKLHRRNETKQLALANIAAEENIDENSEQMEGEDENGGQTSHEGYEVVDNITAD